MMCFRDFSFSLPHPTFFSPPSGQGRECGSEESCTVKASGVWSETGQKDRHQGFPLKLV